VDPERAGGSASGMTSFGSTAAPLAYASTTGPSSPRRPSSSGVLRRASPSVTSSLGNGSECVHQTVQSHVSRRGPRHVPLRLPRPGAREHRGVLATYNTERPHDSLGRVPPLTFLSRPDAPAESTFAVST